MLMWLASQNGNAARHATTEAVACDAYAFCAPSIGVINVRGIVRRRGRRKYLTSSQASLGGRRGEIEEWLRAMAAGIVIKERRSATCREAGMARAPSPKAALWRNQAAEIRRL